MIEIKAFIHQNTVADVVHALGKAGFKNLSLVDVKGTLKALNNDEQQYSMDIAEKIITEAKLELICEDTQQNEVVQIIQQAAYTGKPDAGWIAVSSIVDLYSIEGE
jgi:nitrogen regulatory protein P-II 1